MVALLVIWLALSMIWAEKPASSFTALQPWAACALMFVVLMTLDLTRAQIRMLILAFIIGVTVSVLIGLVGGVKVPTDTSALVDDGRLRGGLDDRTTSLPASCPRSRSPRDCSPASAAPLGASRWRGPAWRS